MMVYTINPILLPTFTPPHSRTDSKHIVNGPHDFYTINRQNNDRANEGASRASHVILYCIFMIGFAMVSVMFLIKLAIDTACMHGCIFNSVPGLNHRYIYIFIQMKIVSYSRLYSLYHI